MSPTLQEYGIDKLSLEARLSLAEHLWESVAEEMEQQPLTDEHRRELERRLAAADANPSDGVPWEQVREAARKRWER